MIKVKTSYTIETAAYGNLDVWKDEGEVHIEHGGGDIIVPVEALDAFLTVLGELRNEIEDAK